MTIGDWMSACAVGVMVIFFAVHIIGGILVAIFGTDHYTGWD